MELSYQSGMCTDLKSSHSVRNLFSLGVIHQLFKFGSKLAWFGYLGHLTSLIDCWLAH